MTAEHSMLLTGARIARPGGVTDSESLHVEGASLSARPAHQDTVSRDLTGHLIVPGFVDVHVHGGGGASYSTTDPDQARTVTELHRAHGTTTTMASLVSGDIAELSSQAAMLADLVTDGELAGVHFEGPFLSENKCGAHEPSLLRAPDQESVRALVKAAKGQARMMTLAPELDGALDAIRLLADQGVTAAVGHTSADYPTTVRAIDAGATVATHLFNAMPPLAHRAPGPIAALLDDERVTIEVINDGTHLHPAVVELAWRAAGQDRLVCITDAMGAAGMSDGVYPLGPMRVQVEDGVARLAEGGSIAGSTLTLDAAFKRAVTENRVPVEQAVRALSETPARLLGMSETVGSLEAGKRADLVVLDEAWNVAGVLRQGRWIVDPGGHAGAGVDGDAGSRR